MRNRTRGMGRGRTSRWATITSVVLLAILVNGCAPAPRGPSLQFQVTHIDDVDDIGGYGPGTANAPAELATVRALQGTVEVAGIIFVPDKCDRVGAHFVRKPKMLQIQVRAQLSSSHAGDCASEGRIRVMQYAVRLSNLPAGSYRLRVVNEYRGLRRGDPAGARWRNTVAYDMPVSVSE